MSHPVGVTAIVKVLFFRHRVCHSSRLQGWHPLLYESLHAFEDLSFGLTGQYHRRSFIRNWEDGAGSRRIETDRTSNFRVPKVVSTFALEWSHPISLDGAYETILAFDGSFIAI